jgi:hypothetical protein
LTLSRKLPPKSSTGYQHTGIKKDTHVSGFKQSIYMPLPDSKENE